MSLFLPRFLRSRPAALARLEAQPGQISVNFAQMVRNILAQGDEFACVAAVLPRIIIAGLAAASAHTHTLRHVDASRGELALFAMRATSGHMCPLSRRRRFVF